MKLFENFTLKGALLTISTVGGLGFVGTMAYLNLESRFDELHKANIEDERAGDEFLRTQFIQMMTKNAEATALKAAAESELASSINNLAQGLEAKFDRVIEEMDDISDTQREANRLQNLKAGSAEK